MVCTLASTPAFHISVHVEHKSMLIVLSVSRNRHSISTSCSKWCDAESISLSWHSCSQRASRPVSQTENALTALTLIPRQAGKLAVWDVTVTCTTAAFYVESSACEAGAAALKLQWHVKLLRTLTSQLQCNRQNTHQCTSVAMWQQQMHLNVFWRRLQFLFCFYCVCCVAVFFFFSYACH